MRTWMFALVLLLHGCFSDDRPTVKEPVKAKEKMPAIGASGKNFKMAMKICNKEHGGVEFVAAGEKFRAECRDGLKIARDSTKETK